MPEVDVNKKRGYEASVPIEKIWEKLDNNIIDKNFCIPLGENKDKEDRFINLTKDFHVLATGNALSGIGVFRRATLTTLLKFNKPEDLKFILIDPLKASFFYFKNINDYLLFPVITENKNALEALMWARQEKERRFMILLDSQCKDITKYNKKYPLNKLPRIVVMITELGELMNFDDKSIEENIVTNLIMAEAVGIHFILTTQQPSSKVITGLITTNIPVKIAFQLPSEEESKLIIYRGGAEKLLGQGDMIVNNIDDSERLQGYFLKENTDEDKNLLFPIGKTTEGEDVFIDFFKNPHLVISGSSGSGKSNFFLYLIAALIKRFNIEELRLILADPKCVEFSVFDDSPYLLRPVIRNSKDFFSAIKELVSEMEKRYQLLENEKAINIVEYNKKTEEKLPYIFLMNDEISDFMADYREDLNKKIEEKLVHLLQTGEAVGINVIISTSRPSTEVLTELLLANFKNRIAFKLATSEDSKLLLHTSGAEKLLGNGDGLFSGADNKNPQRIQTYLISE